MQRMRSVVVSPDHTRVKLGGGHVLYSVYQGLEKYNLTTLGGSVADVGLGGFALGGGMSRLSPKYGLAMDNVFEYESQPDLYFALRGGMNNFGIVTEFTMRAVPKGQVYGGSLTYTADKRSAVLEEAYRLTETWKNDTSMAFYYRFVYDPKANDFTLTVSKEYAYPIMNPAPFAALDRIPSKSSEGRIDWPSRFSMDIISPYGDRNLFATITYSPSVELDRNLQDFLMEEASSIKDVQGFRPNIVIQPLYEAVIRSGKERGGNAAGIDANGPLTLVLFILTWDKAEDDSRINLMAERWLERSNSLTKSVGKHHDWLYINYANKKQDPFAGYGRENHQRLRNIQRQTDPLGIFTSKGLCRGYFKLL
ncbi:hypothetical protein QQS21_008118 [Conoideocrella luteorostrata]|uniref:FAD linked oxidase N-terminal domain-containing protein n=1 Tax=Conoideocrella luteorostrata TaxID=1105319 RepID=A0AAJ0FWB1_9HYPO|nr:hypothetical protein QQS21_008118 [Conoideocrella luteorostrata]